MGSASVYVVAVLQMVSGATLQFISVSEGPLSMYQAPAPYRQHGQPQHSSIILTKPPLRRSGSVDEGRSWDRAMYVSSTLQPGQSVSKPEVLDGSANAPYRYAVDCTDERSCRESFTVEQSTTQPTFKPYSQEELDTFLKKFAATSQAKPATTEEPTNKLANLYMNEPVNVLEAKPYPEVSPSKDESKSSSWHHQHTQSHQHPYDDNTGWVSLEPVPWSSSSIQKWEPNTQNRPQIPPWDSKPEHSHHSTSHWDSKPPQHWSQRPWNKPTYEYKPSSKPQHWNSHHEDQHKPSHWYQQQGEPSPHYPEIITDGLPGHFPSSHDRYKPWDEHRPPYTQVEYHGNKEEQGAEGNGQWVLLSSTKGYSVPQRHRGFHQRAITFSSSAPVATGSVSSHRTVRLTVLPALNGTTNTTTAHGGLLEVEETFQTVDEAQREHAAKMLKHKEEKPGNGTKKEPKAEKRSLTTLKVIASPQQDLSSKRRNAVLAAVGAGMIPATVAMLLPMVLGRKRRMTVDTSQLDDETSLEHRMYK